MSKCRKIGHNFRIEKETSDVKQERCLDCGFTAVFSAKNWAEDKEYMKAHRRDFIQPSDREAWNLAYPDKKIVDDPKRKIEMIQLLREKVGKKRLRGVAEEYFRTYGGNDDLASVLKWHFGI